MSAGTQPPTPTGSGPPRSIVSVHGVLLVTTVALPLALAVLIAWSTWRGIWHEAEGEMRRDAAAVAEFAGRVLDGYYQALERAATVMQGLDTAAIEARRDRLEQVLRDLRASLPDLDSVVVTAPDGSTLLGAPAPDGGLPRGLGEVLREAAPGAPRIGPLPEADGRPGALGLALGLPDGDGAAARIGFTLRTDSVAARLARLSTGSADAAALVHLDGRLLARAAPPGTPPPGSRPAPDSPIAIALRSGIERWSGRGPSPHDSVERLTAFRRVQGFPVYAIVARPADTIVAEWREAVALPVLIALASATLLAVLGLLVSRSQRETLEANARLEQRVAERTVEVAQALAAMRVGDERLRLAVEAAGFGTWELDLGTGTITRTGAPLTDGTAMSLSTFTLEDYSRRMHPEDRARVHAAIADLTDGAATRNRAEYRVLRDDGTTTWVEAYGGVIAWDAETGAPSRLAGVWRDVTDRRHTESLLRASEARLRVAIEAARFSSWEYDALSDSGSRQGDLTTVLPQVPTRGFRFEDWIEEIHPEDRVRMRGAMAAMLSGTRDRMLEEFRVRRPDGSWAIIESAGAVAERDAASGQVLRVAGVARDVTESRMATQRQALLAREVDHRAKNALAVVQAALRLTPRTDADSYARAVEGRVRALARAHTLLAEARWEGASLQALAAAELVAFLPAGPGASAGMAARASIAGPDLILAPPAAQGLSMVLHELATNAVKYGALSVTGGAVALAWAVDEPAGLLRLRWEERGGPRVVATPNRRGFGSRVVEATVRDQLGGTLDRQWRASGLACLIEVPLPRALIGMAAPRERGTTPVEQRVAATAAD